MLSVQLPADTPATPLCTLPVNQRMSLHHSCTRNIHRKAQAAATTTIPPMLVLLWLLLILLLLLLLCLMFNSLLFHLSSFPKVSELFWMLWQDLQWRFHVAAPGTPKHMRACLTISHYQLRIWKQASNPSHLWEWQLMSLPNCTEPTFYTQDTFYHLTASKAGNENKTAILIVQFCAKLLNHKSLDTRHKTIQWQKMSTSHQRSDNDIVMDKNTKHLWSTYLLHSVVVIISLLLRFIEIIPHVSNDGTNLTDRCVRMW